MRKDRSRFSYRSDTSVAPFDDTGPVTIMDAHCSLCARGAAWIARNDKAGDFKIIPLQSTLGRSLMAHYGLDTHDPSSWLYLEDGRAYESLDAFIRVGKRLGGVWKILGVLNILPATAQNLAYGFVARNRYRFFGRTELCTLPNAEVQKRLLQ